ncbi:MAG: tRNA 2-thiouridine(34) synthase MnmA [Fidelibacterota bacterium]
MTPAEQPLGKNRVVVAMSGGVDSSVALLKLLDEGYDTIGVTMKLWESRDSEGNPVNQSYCCSVDAINNAKLVCQKLGVPHYTLDFQEIFRRKVVDYLVEEYVAGRTPNPCIQCNIHLRWGALMTQADLLNAHWIATGHYARVDRSNPEKPVLKKGRDDRKDQTYVLWGIPGETLRRTLFPLGNLTKIEVRQIARKGGLPTADVPESQDICFVPDNDYRRFLRDYAPEKMRKDLPGDFISYRGERMGKHSGISQYTIGQRRGLGVTGSDPVYVQNIDRRSRAVTLAQRSRMFFHACTVDNVNWLQDFHGRQNGEPIRVHIRYHHEGVPCRVTDTGGGTVTVEFEKPQFAVTPGQSAVFYMGDELVGGGIITEGHLHE